MTCEKWGKFTSGCQCSSCEKQRTYNREYQKKWAKAHPGCGRKANIAWRKRNPEKLKQYRRNDYTKNQKKRNAAKRAWDRKQKELYPEKVKAQGTASRKRYEARYPDRYVARFKQHNEIKKKKKREFKQQLLSMLGGKCALCGYVPINPCQIDIHERDGRISSKEWGVSRTPSELLLTEKGRALLLKNIDDLVSLCRNCHVRLVSPHDKEIEEKIEAWIRPA